MNLNARGRLYAAICSILIIVAAQRCTAQDAKPEWFSTAEKSLLGTWKNTNSKTDSIPKIEILLEKETLKIRFWGRTHPEDFPFGPPDALHVLSSTADIEIRVKDDAVAFVTHQADFAVKHFTLRLRDDVIHLEGITIFTDGSGRSNRIYNATFKKE